MKQSTIKKLTEATRHFYAVEARSFDQTRQRPWPGWLELASLLEAELLNSHPRTTLTASPLRVLDVAAGNLRFERFLHDTFPAHDLNATVIDQELDLIHRAPPSLQKRVSVHAQDIIQTLIDERPLIAPPSLHESFNLTVCFGFYHHVPSLTYREALVQQLIDATEPGGLIALSCWQFMHDQRIARKARVQKAQALLDLSLEEGDLEAGDELLGWKDDHVWRYCHHAREDELTHIIDVVAPHAQLIQRFHADGATHNLNAYLVFKRKNEPSHEVHSSAHPLNPSALC